MSWNELSQHPHFCVLSFIHSWIIIWKESISFIEVSFLFVLFACVQQTDRFSGWTHMSRQREYISILRLNEIGKNVFFIFFHNECFGHILRQHDGEEYCFSQHIMVFRNNLIQSWWRWRVYQNSIRRFAYRLSLNRSSAWISDICYGFHSQLHCDQWSLWDQNHIRCDKRLSIWT